MPRGEHHRHASLAIAVLLCSVACGPGGSTGTASPRPSASAAASPSPSTNACSSTAATPASSEPQLLRASLAYDQASRQLILFGDPNGGQVSQTWAWTAQSGWKQLSPAHSPPGRTWGNATYDESTSAVILFGGQSATPINGGLNPLADTWSWNGADWSQLSPASSPPPTVNMSMDYEPLSHLAIGVRTNDSSAKVETWQFDGSTWSQLLPGQSPQYSKQGAGMAYSPAVSASVLFGTQYGINQPPADATTWTHAANTWSAYPPTATGPQPRSWPGMATDQQGGVLMFGGGASDNTALGETWEWAGAWSKKTSSISPPGREMPLMAYDSTCKLVVLYGGEIDTHTSLTQFSDTWVWDGQAWTKVG